MPELEEWALISRPFEHNHPVHEECSVALISLRSARPQETTEPSRAEPHFTRWRIKGVAFGRYRTDPKPSTDVPSRGCRSILPRTQNFPRSVLLKIFPKRI